MPEENTVQDLTLEELSKATQMRPEELFSLNVPASCDKGHEALSYTPTSGKELHVDCRACGYNDIEYSDAPLRLFNV